MNPFDYIDEDIVKDFEYFLGKITEKALFDQGIIDGYDDQGIPALHSDVEYFLHMITGDDRMNYIAQNIVSIPDSQLSPRNKICNTLISHFYGARGIHQTIMKESDPKKAHVDFERFLKDERYRLILRRNLQDARDKRVPIYGTTELRTSLFGAANRQYVTNHSDPDNRNHPGNILEWVANFITDETIDKILESKSLKETVQILGSIPGIGNYYSYHGSTSNSVNPVLPFNHDEKFVLPGPGCCKTLDVMFPNLIKKQMSYGDRVIWFRENQKNLIPNLTFHPHYYNIVDNNGKKIFEDEQNELKTYCTEVALCQYSVYSRLKQKPHLAKRRKVARVEHCEIKKKPKGLEAIFDFGK